MSGMSWAGQRGRLQILLIVALQLLSITALFAAGIVRANENKAQDLSLSLVAMAQLERHHGDSKKHPYSLKEAASFPLFEVVLAGEFAPAAEIYVALEAQDTRLALTSAYASFLLDPQPIAEKRTISTLSPPKFKHHGLWVDIGLLPDAYGLQSQTEQGALTAGFRHISTYATTSEHHLQGVRLERLSDQVTTQFGIFRDTHLTLLDEKNKPWSAGLRLAVRTDKHSDSRVQLGASFNIKDLFFNSRWLPGEPKLDEGFSDTALVSPVGQFNSAQNATDSEQRGAVEFTWHRKGLTLQSESFYRQVNAINDGIGAVLNGYYVELSWLTKGEVRHFDPEGILNGIRPVGPWGSFEWLVGVDELNHRRTDNQAVDRLDSWFVGHNWYANPQVKVYSLLRYSEWDAGFHAQGVNGEGYSFRLGAQLEI